MKWLSEEYGFYSGAYVMGFDIELREPKPISVNAMYSEGPHGRRFLTTEGKHYKDKLREETSRAVSILPWKIAVDGVYKQGASASLEILLVMDNLLNGAWKVGGGTTGKGDPQSPYRRIDGSNYIKLIEDAVAEGIGIDDSANLRTVVEKAQSKTNPRTIIRYRIYE